MARREIFVSDVSGREIEEGQVARVVVSDHPALGSRTVELDAAVDEVEGWESSQINLVSIGIQLPGQSGVRRVVMEVAAFDRLFGDQDVSAVLQGARSGGAVAAPRRGRAAASRPAASGPKIDYTHPDHFGQLHRGRVTEEEAALVRDHLDQANKNRAAAGQPEINPEDPAEKKRYSFPS